MVTRNLSIINIEREREEESEKQRDGERWKEGTRREKDSMDSCVSLFPARRDFEVSPSSRWRSNFHRYSIHKSTDASILTSILNASKLTVQLFYPAYYLIYICHFNTNCIIHLFDSSYFYIIHMFKYCRNCSISLYFSVSVVNIFVNCKNYKVATIDKNIIISLSLSSLWLRKKCSSQAPDTRFRLASILKASDLRISHRNRHQRHAAPNHRRNLSSNATIPNFRRRPRWKAGTKSQQHTESGSRARHGFIYAAYKVSIRSDAPLVRGSSLASRELCCSATESFAGKLPHKQVERATKAFWRQPPRNTLCAWLCVSVREGVRASACHLPQESTPERG